MNAKADPLALKLWWSPLFVITSHPREENDEPERVAEEDLGNPGRTETIPTGCLLTSDPFDVLTVLLLVFFARRTGPALSLTCRGGRSTVVGLVALT